MHISMQSLQQLRNAAADLVVALNEIMLTAAPAEPEPLPEQPCKWCGSTWDSPREDGTCYGCGAAPVIIHPECLSPVPDGYDTVLGFLARHHPDALECFDYTDPTTTQRDGWWLSHRFTPRCYVPAPPVLREQGIEHVRAYPVELLHKRWG